MLLGLLAATASVRAAEPGCPPFEEPTPTVQVARAARGVEASPERSGAGAGVAAPGAIVALPASPVVPLEAPAGEALLALPKTPDGGLPTGYELAPGARIAESFFSPVLCATVARVVGAETASPRELVAVVPDTAMVVPNSVYATAEAEVAPAQPEPDRDPDRDPDPDPDPDRDRDRDPDPDPYRILQYALDQLGVGDARVLGDGAGARIAVLDSAPEAAHRDLDVVMDPVEGGPSAAPAVHGTLVAGLVGAITGNGFGMAGIAPGASVLAVPVCTPQGATASDRCVLYDLLRGVDRSWEREAQVVNLAIVGPDNPLLERAMARLDDLGVLVVASAGNEGTQAPRFPAAYPSVIGVGAADRERRRSPRSNTGLSAEILAPGVEVLSAVPGSAFAFGSGTSFAAAHVSGVLGLLIGAGADPAAARAALFQQAHEAALGGPVLLPPVCDVLARLGRRCEAP